MFGRVIKIKAWFGIIHLLVQVSKLCLSEERDLKKASGTKKNAMYTKIWLMSLVIKVVRKLTRKRIDIIAIMTDTDNSEKEAESYYGDIEFSEL